MGNAIENLLDELEEAKRRFDAAAPQQITRCLEKLSHSRFQGADQLIRCHEILLFIRAYPFNETIRQHSDALLESFLERVEALRASAAEMSPLDAPEVSGIVGTVVSAAFSYKIAQWFTQRFPKNIDVDWEAYQKKERLGVVLPRLLPLLDEDALVEANVPYLDWLHAAKPASESDLSFLLRCVANLPITEKEKAALYDSLELPIYWTLDDSRLTRTRMRLATRKFFYHNAPLLQRREVSITKELESAPLRLQQLSVKEGERALDLARASSASRYRELYGFTHGEAGRVTKTNLGRGVEALLYELPPPCRLPWRAYHCAMMFKNGVAIGYVETLSLFERTEVGFNLYYTFREGETAWLYARLLKLFHQLFGATCFSIDPYQIGFHNHEAIESGAFWFYRKLGFRPIKPDILRLVEAEEEKLAKHKEYRTPPRVLRKIAAGHLLFEIAQASNDWDHFQLRHLGLAVQKRLADDFNGDAQTLRESATTGIAQALKLRLSTMPTAARQGFENLAMVLAMVADLPQWSADEKHLVRQIVQAKLSAAEAEYLRLLQRHERLRAAILRLGSAGAA
ncbi:MAG: hypothetical protein HY231_03745 [Acidobacteria bacterium]|nr:hypothetical protein [Acidobacteriota bacterium]